MLRITSGLAKGKKLVLPNNQKVTAVKEVVKLAIFSILGDKIVGAKCLDLYAGSGNLGIEALSRGAESCDFVDEAKSAVEAIEKNLRICGLAKKANTAREDALKYLSNASATYDIIFADPYYATINHKYLIKLGLEHLNPNGVFFLLTSSNQKSRGNNTLASPNIGPSADLTASATQETRRYGKTLLTLLTKD